jgi:hypothetical protein
MSMQAQPLLDRDARDVRAKKQLDEFERNDSANTTLRIVVFEESTCASAESVSRTIEIRLIAPGARKRPFEIVKKLPSAIGWRFHEAAGRISELVVRRAANGIGDSDCAYNEFAEDLLAGLRLGALERYGKFAGYFLEDCAGTETLRFVMPDWLAMREVRSFLYRWRNLNDNQ